MLAKGTDSAHLTCRKGRAKHVPRHRPAPPRPIGGEPRPGWRTLCRDPSCRVPGGLVATALSAASRRLNFQRRTATGGTFPNALCLAPPLHTGTKAMQSRKLVKAALVKEIDAVRLSISLLEKELWTAGRPNKIRWRSGYELTAQKARLAKLENVLAHYPSVTRARALDSNSLSYGQRNQVS